MLGFRYIKFQPNQYVLKFKNGKIKKEGAGLSFWYFAPSTSLVSVPMGSIDTPFIFEETTADYQAVTVQGQVSFRIAEPKKLASLLNYTLDALGKNYVAEDHEKLPQRVINATQVLTRKVVSSLSLKQTLSSSESIVNSVTQGLKNSEELRSLGLEILGFSILAIRPNKETARALEAEVREQILKGADDATYARRNSALEQERKIKENELNTEIAVENKRRQIREAQMDAERAVQERQHSLLKADLQFQIEQEMSKKNLVELKTENDKLESNAKSYAIATVMKALENVQPYVLEAISVSGMNPQQLIAAAFRGISEKADKIGQLNVTPDLLQDLMRKE